MRPNIIELFETTFKECAQMPALTDYLTHKTSTYLQLAESVARYHVFFENAGIRRGDKVALMSESTSAFVKAYVAVVTYGAVCVPILPGFSTPDAAFIINHSDSRLLMTEKKIWERIGESQLDNIMGVYDLNDAEILKVVDEKFENAFKSLPDDFKAKYPDGFSADDIKYAKVGDEDLMIISYTSGTTGSPKGVMLPIRSITANAYFAMAQPLHFRGSNALSILPLAHAFACAFDMFYPLALGVHVTLLGKIPSPTILTKAMAEVKPTIMCVVPLVLEKIVKGKIWPVLRKQPVKFLTKIPGINNLIYKKVCRQLLDTFGGRLVEVPTGGAALDPEVEKFLLKIKFPVIVGYGMTECGPLVSYSTHKDFVRTSVGAVVYEGDVRIDKPGKDGIGEVCINGAHVMLGYYKNPELTAQTIDKDGWLHTGDIGFVREIKGKKVIFLRGRNKTMILSADGQNIYPEEIEFKLNDLPFVQESFVFAENGSLVALVYPNFELAKKQGLDNDALRDKMKENVAALNAAVGSYERIKEIRLLAEPFIKTPKQSIKRNLYPQEAVLL